MTTYATDGNCHNAEPGTFGHECGQPATWIGTKPTGFRSGFCDDCKDHGAEARAFKQWQRIRPANPNNHITRLMTEREELRLAVRNAREQLTELERYLTSAKFAAPDCDYVHVRTDILPKISNIRWPLCGIG